MRRFVFNVIIFIVAIFICQVLLTLDYSIVRPDLKNGLWYGVTNMVKIKVPDPGLYTPGKEIKEVQPYLKTDSLLGFVWVPDISESDNARFTWGDQEPCFLTTDEWGFINSPDAIADRTSGHQVNIVSTGASFMQGAASVFYDFFSIHGSLCYNLATHRHTLPMFTEAFKRHGIPLKPQWLIYELNEASPLLINDYYDWKKSDMDWFTYHSGTWSGPAKSTQYHIGMLEKFPRLQAIAVTMLKKVYKKTPSQTTAPSQLSAMCFREIIKADSLAKLNHIRCIVLYIPSKETMWYGSSSISAMVDMLVPDLAKANVNFIDLRPAFNATGDPRSLYYAVDGHWNKSGILVAARAVKSYMDSVDNVQH